MAPKRTGLKRLCCFYAGEASGGFDVWPKGGQWTLRNLYDIMVRCESVECLRGVSPMPITEGGFSWDNTPESDAAVREIFPSYGDNVPTRQIRTYSVSSRMIRETADTWKTEMPKRTDFDTPMELQHPYCGRRAGPMFECRAKFCPSAEMVQELAKLFKLEGHRVRSVKFRGHATRRRNK